MAKNALLFTLCGTINAKFEKHIKKKNTNIKLKCSSRPGSRTASPANVILLLTKNNQQSIEAWEKPNGSKLQLLLESLQHNTVLNRPLTVQFRGGAIPLEAVGRQDAGLVVELAVGAAGRFVVRPPAEFQRAHVAAAAAAAHEREQRLAQLPRKHQIPGKSWKEEARWDADEAGGEKKKEKYSRG